MDVIEKIGMKAGTPSRTARLTAVCRARESAKPEVERICSDPIAGKLVGDNWNPLGEFPLPRTLAFNLYEIIAPGWDAYFVARTRYIDDALLATLQGGLPQLVILGAGYDSRAYRFERLPGSTRVFEVDHPATQEFKLARLAEAFGGRPAHVTYVSVDFSTQTLQARLKDSGYEPGQQTFFIWEGVSMYLPSAAVDETLSFVAHTARGNSLVFDHTYPSVIDGTHPNRGAKAWRMAARRYGEDLLFGIERGEIQTFLAKRGFSVVDIVDHRSLKERYFSRISEPRSINPAIQIVHARVG